MYVYTHNCHCAVLEPCCVRIFSQKALPGYLTYWRLNCRQNESYPVEWNKECLAHAYKLELHR